jgi:hypothetical protein
MMLRDMHAVQEDPLAAPFQPMALLLSCKHFDFSNDVCCKGRAKSIASNATLHHTPADAAPAAGGADQHVQMHSTQAHTYLTTVFCSCM